MYFINFGQLYEYNFISKVWTQKANFPGVANSNRKNLTVVDTTLFVCNDGVNTFYSYNTLTKTWLQKANYPGLPSEAGISFSLGDKIYKGGGAVTSNQQYLTTFYE